MKQFASGTSNGNNAKRRSQWGEKPPSGNNKSGSSPWRLDRNSILHTLTHLRARIMRVDRHFEI